ncbi:MAG: hypothetical protein LBI03_11575 [Clostridiales bacterium]|jgi:tetratricopeptide (TPR) repeat protein|nr:hypothetical protein [Clostridiales bacterium]
MSFNVNEQDKELINAAISYVRQGLEAQAYLIFSGQKDMKEPAALFAFGLCHFHAEDFTAAIPCFEQAIKFLKAVPTVTRTAAENSESYINLYKKQIEAKTYLMPMTSDFCAMFPKVAEQNILLALIDTYMCMNMTEQAQRLASGLTGPVFETYKNKLRS